MITDTNEESDNEEDRGPVEGDGAAPGLYYIHREGTNIRATTRDGEPTVVEGYDRAVSIANGYEEIVRPRVGSLVPISVKVYHLRFDRDVESLKAEAVTVHQNAATTGNGDQP